MSTTKLAVFAFLILSVAADHWKPTAGTPWQIVLLDPLAAPYPVGIKAIDGDLYSNPPATWSSLNASGIHGICYFSAGSFENWRPDANEFNNETDIGAPLKGWKGEWWLNTKSDNVRRIMGERLDLAVKNGCSAVDPDNVDAYDNGGGGLGLTEDDAVDYVTFLATEAHKRNLAIGLKNAGAIVSRVLNMVDFQVNEQCEYYNECDLYRPFIDAGKPVFGIEYTKKDNEIPSDEDVAKICSNPSSQGFSTVIKHIKLNSWVVPCNVTATSASGSATNAGNNSIAATTSTATTPPYNGSGHRPNTFSGIALVIFAGVLCFLL